MFFNSLSYLFFLTVAVVVLYIVPGRYQWLWLLICSIFFYITLLPEYLILFVALIALNYFLGIAIERPEEKRKRNSIFIFSIIANIAVLGFFKYFGVLQSLISGIKEASDKNHLLKIILPVGLSFLIFTILSYLIEIKRGTINAEKHPGIFASTLLFFPKIMQGPIERPGNIFPQFRIEKHFDYDMVVDGLKLMLWGYFKKLVVADRLALYVNAVYDNYNRHSGTSLLVATVFYSFQIYADFSGYTDIALGSAKVLGFNLTNNFNRPYFADSISEFWNRWHISFSGWLRDYLFLPLAIILSRKMSKGKYLRFATEKWIFLFSSMITFAVCGIWHGQGLNFLIWGLLFGTYLSVANWTLGFNKRLRKKMGISKKSAFYRIYNILLTFVLVTFAWIFFRADSMHDALQIVKKIFSLNGSLFLDKTTIIYSIFGIAFLFLIETRQELGKTSNLPFRTKSWFMEQLAYASLAIIILLVGVFDSGQFIYFQF